MYKNNKTKTDIIVRGILQKVLSLDSNALESLQSYFSYFGINYSPKFIVYTSSTTQGAAHYTAITDDTDAPQYFKVFDRYSNAFSFMIQDIKAYSERYGVELIEHVYNDEEQYDVSNNRCPNIVKTCNGAKWELKMIDNGESKA